jgi:hypothetical protein
MMVAQLSLGVGCLDAQVVLGPVEGGGGSGAGTGGDGPIPTDPRVDLLVVVDNSIGMAGKQELFAEELAQLVSWLADPPCMTDDGRVVEAGPSSVNRQQCSPGGKRRFAPVRDLHLGFVSSSLGDLTSGACSSVTNPDDQGRLLTRSLGVDGTYQGWGFLAFDPDQQMNPPGDADFDVFASKLSDLLDGVGSVGCGYEMPLEAMTRFLVDPAPYASLSAESGLLVKQGVDEYLLSQRAGFLRDRSNLAVILLTDEDDCSVDTTQQGFLALRSHAFFRATSECELDPNDPCCSSCGLPVEAGCDAGGSCAINGGRYTAAQDHPNLKCWDHKRRYGVDFLNPIERYANALSAVQIDPSVPSLAGDALVDNPLFAGGRHPNQVAFLTIAGVPWQDLVADPSDLGAPNLSSAALQASGQWDWITGPVTDPFMRATYEIRSGTSPATGESTSTPNSVNIGDYAIDTDAPDDLQRACAFSFDEPIPNGPSCGVYIDSLSPDPLCEPDGTQLGDGATPGLRPLAVARALGDRGVVGSICRDPDQFASAQALLARLADVLP